MTLLLGLFTGTAYATDFYWNGNSGTSDNIDQGANWFSGTNPASGDNLYFNNTTGSRHWAYSNYGAGSWFNYLITYSGAGGIKLYGDNTYALKFENNSDPSLLELSPSSAAAGSREIGNRIGYDLEINPVGAGGILVSCDKISIDNTTAARTLKVYGTNTLNINGIIYEKNGSGAKLQILGAATVVLKGNSTYTGTTTISAGTLQLNPSANTTPASQIVLDGGTLSTSGITATRTIISSKTLQLNNSSTIALGTGDHTLKFAASNGLTWVAGKTITITGWTGTAGQSGTGGKIFVGTTNLGLTAPQLSQISFSGYGAAMMLSTGEIVPLVPNITKTVGTTGANYATLKLAFDDINNNVGNAFTGAVTLQVIDNTTDAAQMTLNASLGVKTISTTVGSGYVAPKVSLTGGVATSNQFGTIVTTVINGCVTNITMTASSGAWTTIPTGVTIDAPAGGGTTATAIVTSISSNQLNFTITNEGSGYGPVASFSGGGGSGASLETKIVPAATAPGTTPAGVPLAIVLACPGTGYTSTPTISFTTGWSGSGAAATVTAIQACNYSAVNIYPTVTGKTIGNGTSLGAALIQLTGVNNLTIDGRLHDNSGNITGSTPDLTFTNIDTGTNSYTFRFDGSSNNTIKYCTIKGSSNSQYSRGTIAFQNYGNCNNHISNNVITTADATNRPVNSIFASGSGSMPNTNNYITDNEFVDFLTPTRGGSAINIGIENNSWTITGNSFYEQNVTSVSATSSLYNIIYVSNVLGTGFTVSNNYIGGSAANCGGSAWSKTSANGNNAFTGIYLNLGGTPASSVQNNTIQNINWANSAAASWTGISFTGSAMDIGNTTGNTIGSTTGTGSIVFTGGPSGPAFTAINILNKGAGGLCNNNKIGSIIAGNSSSYTTFTGIFNNLSTGTTSINNNIIGSTTTLSSINASAVIASEYLYGIRTNSTGTTTINSNTIANITNYTTNASTSGIILSAGTNTVNGNFIYNLFTPSSTSGTPATIYGINIGTSAASSTSTYSNNIIILGSENTPCAINGIYENNNTVNSSITNIFFNTVYIGAGVQATGSATSSFCFRSDNGTANVRDIRNNIFVSTRSTTGGSTKHYVFYFGQAATANSITCNYNDYYFTGTAGILARFNASYPTVLPIVTGQLGNDANSKNTNPSFVGAAAITAGTAVIADYRATDAGILGATGTGISTDYASTSRTTTPSMGAWEVAYFKSKATGNWADVSSWQSSKDNSTFADVTYAPTNSAASVSIINSHLITVASNATSASLTINSGGKLSINSGSTLGVTGNFNINSDNTNGTGTFVDANTNGGGLTVSGTSTVQQYLNAAHPRNWYVSSPLSGATVPASGYVFNKRNEPTAAWITMTSGEAMNAGQGYILNPTAAPGTYSFTGGSLNNGNVTSSLIRTQGATKEGFNLVGNPYPSHVTMSYNILNNAGLLNTIWYRTVSSYDSGNSKYIYTFNTYLMNSDGTSVSTPGGTTGIVAPMQAFWIRQSAVGSGSFTFSNAMRSHQTTNPLKVKAANNAIMPLLRLQVSNSSNISDETVLYFNTNASNNYDSYDAVKISNGSTNIPELFTIATVGSEQLAINGMNSIPLDTDIPLGFATGESNTFTIKASQISEFETGTQIILLDKLLNIEQDLTLGDYSFSSDKASNTDRFALVFKTSSIATVINSTANNNLWISKNNNNQIVVTGGNYVTVYNTSGQKIIVRNITSSITVLDNNLPSGVYFVNLGNADKMITKKIIID